MFAEYAVVKLAKECLGVPVPVGTIGTVLMILRSKGSVAYEVEFSGMKTEELTYTITEDCLTSIETEK